MDSTWSRNYGNSQTWTFPSEFEQPFSHRSIALPTEQLGSVKYKLILIGIKSIIDILPMILDEKIQNKTAKLFLEHRPTTLSDLICVYLYY